MYMYIDGLIGKDEKVWFWMKVEFWLIFKFSLEQIELLGLLPNQALQWSAHAIEDQKCKYPFSTQTDKII